MSRPIYETPTTLKAEAEIAGLLERLWDVRLRSLPRKYMIDFAATRKTLEIVALIEVKTRSKAHHETEHFMLDVKKVDAMLRYSELLSAPSYLVVRWTDRIGYINVTPASLKLPSIMTGRRDRGDPDDIQPMVRFSVDCFTWIGGKR